MIENSTSNIPNTCKTSIRRDIISDWIIENSILSKALEGITLKIFSSNFLSLYIYIN